MGDYLQKNIKIIAKRKKRNRKDKLKEKKEEIHYKTRHERKMLKRNIGKKTIILILNFQKKALNRVILKQ